MHLAELYRILSHEKFDVFAAMDKAMKLEIRKLMIQMILATDLARHFSHISKLKSRKFAVSEESRAVDIVILMETLLMMSDLGHTAKPFQYHQIWANRISEEFFWCVRSTKNNTNQTFLTFFVLHSQGDAEERNNLPVSPLCDRKQANLPKSQVTFLTIIATPLFETAGDAFQIEEFDGVKAEVHNNIKQWQGLILKSDASFRSMARVGSVPNAVAVTVPNAVAGAAAPATTTTSSSSITTITTVTPVTAIGAGAAGDAVLPLPQANGTPPAASR